MKLYDDCIGQVNGLLSQTRKTELSGGSAGPLWPDAGKNQLIFRSDMAYELGGGTLPALSGVLLTEDERLAPQDRVILCGKDLGELDRDTPYARIELVRVRADRMGEGPALYQAIRKIEYTRYHLNPQGFMLRISASSHRESVRVSKEALAQGLDFARVGQCFGHAYHAHPAVEAVTTVFITDPAFAYKELEKILRRSEQITKALDHLLQKVKMDCHVCGLREVCAEVEQMCKTDFPET